MIHVRLLTHSDIGLVINRVCRSMSDASLENEFINPFIDEEQVSRWLASTSGHVALDGDHIVGHIVGTLLDGEVWLNSDSVSFDSPEVLTALLGAAPFLGLPVNVWTYGDVGTWTDLGFTPVSERGTLSIDRVRDVMLSPEVVVRRASTEDLESAVSLDGILENEQSHEAEVGVATSPQEILEMLSDPEVHHYLAQADGVVLSQAITYPMPERRGSWPDTLHLSGVVTVPHRRNEGIAHALVASALNDAYFAGFAYCEVNWRAFNEVASRFWKNFGFTTTCTRLRRQF